MKAKAPRTGEILRGRVQMFHNVMDLVQDWYFTQVGPLDPRAQSLPLPDSLMDYSRFNYVAQPEDGIPVELLIPGIGPDDEFAVKWGYAPIPGATTPEEERETLELWARQQDTIPWYRFTTSGAPNHPYALTEAVGDEDAVRSSELGLRNLERVKNMLLDVAEQPGESYDLLDDLYGNVVSQ